MNIIRLIKGNTVEFYKYRHQHIYYGIDYQHKRYVFPVPLEDIQDATLNHTEKAITLMRYIRKSLDEGTLVAL